MSVWWRTAVEVVIAYLGVGLVRSGPGNWVPEGERGRLR